MNTPIQELAEKLNYCIQHNIDLSEVSLKLKINGVEGEISIPNPEVDFVWIRSPNPDYKKDLKYSGIELRFSSKENN